MVSAAPSRLEPDPATAWIVAELFTRYAAGGWSTPSLALWMNTDSRLPKPRIRHNRDGQVISADQWTGSSINYILRDPVYRGAIRFNHEPDGVYERAAPDAEVTVEDKHPAPVSPALWHAVQERLDAAPGAPTPT